MCMEVRTWITFQSSLRNSQRPYAKFIRSAYFFSFLIDLLVFTFTLAIVRGMGTLKNGCCIDL